MLNKRIRVAMDLRSDAVKALSYPHKEQKKDFEEDEDDEESDGDPLSRLLESLDFDFD